jgi:hypothetical protein
MFSWNAIIEWLVSGLFQNFVWVIIGIFFVEIVQKGVDRYRYGGWRVIVTQKGDRKVNRPVSVGKSKEIFSEPAELAVFLKGVASPYGWINCDLLEEGKQLKLYVEDIEKRQMIIDLDKNPPGDKRREGA